MDAWIRLILTLLAGAALLTLLVAWLTARIFIRPPRMTDGKAAWVLKRLSPGDLGLPFTSLTFDIRDEHSGKPLRLAAWWIPRQASHGRCILLVHGYADAKVGAIAWAPIFYALGWNILAIDLRAHGQSQGPFTTAGYFEKHDLNQVLNQLQAEKPDQARTLLLLGASMGAAAALGTASLRSDIAGVILDSPYVDFRHACAVHARHLGLPAAIMPLALKFASWITGADLLATRVPHLVASVRCPILAIAGARDPYLLPEDLASLRGVIESRADGSALWIAPASEHLMPLLDEPVEYRHRIEAFLARILTAPAASQDPAQNNPAPA